MFADHPFLARLFDKKPRCGGTLADGYARADDCPDAGAYAGADAHNDAHAHAGPYACTYADAGAHEGPEPPDGRIDV
jgi:hypothetical protein